MEHFFFRMMGFSGWLGVATAFFICTICSPNAGGYGLLFWTLFLLLLTIVVARTEEDFKASVKRWFGHHDDHEKSNG